MKYTVDYFIKKFEAIPDEKWCVANRYNSLGQKCAHGHCYRGNPNLRNTNKIEEAFEKLATDNYHIVKAYGFGYINNGSDTRYQQPTPKDRVLAVLNDIKNAQQQK